LNILCKNRIQALFQLRKVKGSTIDLCQGADKEQEKRQRLLENVPGETCPKPRRNWYPASVPNIQA
jgi:hypothetical protein